MEIALVLLHLRPDLDLLNGCVLRNDGDGPPTYIAEWHDSRPQPTAAEIAAAWPEAQRGATIAAIDAHANALRNGMTAGITPAEMASWSIKRGQAMAYQGDPAACPMLAAEAAARGVPLSAIVDRVLAAASALSAAEAAIAGTAGRHKDAVKTAADPSAYDWSGGWPL